MRAVARVLSYTPVRRGRTCRNLSITANDLFPSIGNMVAGRGARLREVSQILWHYEQQQRLTFFPVTVRFNIECHSITRNFYFRVVW